MIKAAWLQIFRRSGGLALGLAIFWLGLQAAVLGPTLPLLISEFGGLDKGQVTLFFSLGVAAGIVIPLGIGHLSDGRVRRSTLALVFGAIAAAANFGLTMTKISVVLYLLEIFAAFGLVHFSLFFAAAKSEILASFPTATQTIGTSILRALFSLGFVIGTGLASLLLLVLDVPTLFRAVSVISLTLTLYSFAMFRGFERRKHAAGPVAAEPADERRFSWAAVILPLAAVSVLQGADRLRGIYLPLVTFAEFHDEKLAPQMFGIAAAFELVTMVAMGALAARIGERWTVILGALSGAAYFVILACSQSLAALYLANILWAVFIGALMGVAMAYLQHLVHHRPGLGGAMFPVTINTGAVAGIFLPLIVTGYQPSIYWIGALLCVVGAIMLAPRPNTK
jgi:MFS family permease